MGLGARVGQLIAWRQMLLAFSMGAAMGLSQAPWSLPVVLFATVPTLYWLHAGAQTYRRAALIGWVAGLGYFGVTLGWIIEPFLVDIARHGWMAPFALILMAGGMAVFWGAAFGVARRGNALSLAVFWALAGLIRSYIFTGFPWALPAYGWVETPVIQMVSLVGPHGLGLLTLLSLALLGAGAKRMVVGLAMIAAMWSFGAYRLSHPLIPRAEPFTLRVIQPNAEQHLKWLPEFQRVFFERQLELSGTAPAPDLVIWPEAAIPFLPSERPDLLQSMATSANGAALVTGTRLRDDAGNWYNGLVMLDAVGGVIGQYEKHHLVPFGEYIPLAHLLDGTPLRGLTGTGFTAGEGPVVIDAAGVPAYLPLICYEAIFPQHARVDGPRPEWILQITNDAWFGKISGPYQHLAQSQVRAIEHGLPLARSANTGVSGVIDPYGRIVAELPLGSSGFVDVPLPSPLPVTMYGRMGDLPVAALLTLLAFMQLIAAKIRLNGKI